jgi:hypothetical protein
MADPGGSGTLTDVSMHSTYMYITRLQLFRNLQWNLGPQGRQTASLFASSLKPQVLEYYLNHVPRRMKLLHVLLVSNLCLKPLKYRHESEGTGCLTDVIVSDIPLALRS